MPKNIRKPTSMNNFKHFVSNTCFAALSAHLNPKLETSQEYHL